MNMDVMGVQEVSPGYEFVAENPAVPVGYKQTEVGVIPEDWSVESIGEIFNLINGVAFKPSDWKQHGMPIIRIQNLNDPSASFNYSQLPVAERNHVVKGDLLFAWSGTVGTSFGARIWQGPEGVLNQHIFKVTMNEEQIHRHFALIVFSQVEDDIAKQAHGFKASFLHVKKSDLTKIKISLPQIHEQRAIATALSDVDALLEELDRLIAKKRDIKQAAMQQILTGETRLPGFEGEWSKVCMGDFGHTYGGLVGKSKGDFGVGSAFYVPFTSVMESAFIDCHKLEKVRVAVGESQNQVVTGDILFNGSSETPEEVAMCALMKEEITGLYLNSFCFGFRLKETAEVDPLFLVFFMRSSLGREVVKSLAQGSTRYNLSKTALLNAELSLPKLQEQKAIAIVLSDMDTEIQALEQRRSKTAELKQGMMQELLTGRTRLV